MNLINELMTGWDIAALEAELDLIEESYKDLVMFTSLFEGVLDTLPDDIIEKVAEIEKRLDAVGRARVLLTKLKKTGGYTPDQVKSMRGRVTRNAKKLKDLLATTKSALEKMGSKVKQEVEKIEADEKENSNGTPELDLRDLDRGDVNVLRKIASGRFNADALDDMEAMEVLGNLESLGLISGDNKITSKGKKALANLRSSMQGRRSTSDQARRDREDREELADV